MNILLIKLISSFFIHTKNKVIISIHIRNISIWNIWYAFQIIFACSIMFSNFSIISFIGYFIQNILSFNSKLEKLIRCKRFLRTLKILCEFNTWIFVTSLLVVLTYMLLLQCNIYIDSHIVIASRVKVQLWLIVVCTYWTWSGDLCHSKAQLVRVVAMSDIRPKESNFGFIVMVVVRVADRVASTIQPRRWLEWQNF